MDFKNVILMSDLDGTLLTDDKRIDERDLAAIARFRAGDGLFTAATGRGIAMAKSVVERLGIDIPCVIFNGAAVYDFREKKFLWHSDMPPCADDYIRMLEERFPDVGIEILHADSVYVTDDNETVREHMAIEGIEPIRCSLADVPREDRLKVLIAYPPERIGEIIDFTRERCAADVNWVHSSPMYYEMLPAGISKGYGFRRLIELLGRDGLFTVAVGDYGNDTDMVRAADYGAAVANAREEVKRAAKVVLRDNNHAPISQLIDLIAGL
ncbi:MAG: HAD family hydrolase [Bacteroides sp.]|nr:HAD family hydrolase [Eubacterium sp.]MCM1417331.1 HAD family hydrolase [Roseburia sp.]MCM1461476.1 HAD family hydrolase [Bacteroides sp.]